MAGTADHESTATYFLVLIHLRRRTQLMRPFLAE